MKIIFKADLLEEIRKKRGITIAELIRRVDAINEAIYKADVTKTKREKMTRGSYYWYLKGIPPSQDRLYAICTILNTTPKRLMTTWENPEKWEEIKKIYSQLEFGEFKKHST